MHEFVVFATFLIFFSCESSKAFFENVHSKRIITSDNDIDSKIEFKTIDEEWVVDVAAHYMFIVDS